MASTYTAELHEEAYYNTQEMMIRGAGYKCAPLDAKFTMRFKPQLFTRGQKTSMRTALRYSVTGSRAGMFGNQAQLLVRLTSPAFWATTMGRENEIAGMVLCPSAEALAECQRRLKAHFALYGATRDNADMYGLLSPPERDGNSYERWRVAHRTGSLMAPRETYAIRFSVRMTSWREKVPPRATFYDVVQEFLSVPRNESLIGTLCDNISTGTPFNVETSAVFGDN
jgi:hypothetical protein